MNYCDTYFSQIMIIDSKLQRQACKIYLRGNNRNPLQSGESGLQIILPPAGLQETHHVMEPLCFRLGFLSDREPGIVNILCHFTSFIKLHLHIHDCPPSVRYVSNQSIVCLPAGCARTTRNVDRGKEGQTWLPFVDIMKFLHLKRFQIFEFRILTRLEVLNTYPIPLNCINSDVLNWMLSKLASRYIWSVCLVSAWTSD